ncbi:MAG: DegT/DnrJ/EryC1/StrS aminotransferase family protein [Defluviitaleaceae bacterium]|nr:DegT/DnrJ/EryC1/StrS aminotransferase family protein [Defluviitaleaceae bacterium]
MKIKHKKNVSHSKPTISIKQYMYLSMIFLTRNLSTGKVVKKLEEVLSKYHQREYCVVTNSGTSALHLYFLSVIKEKGDEIIIPGYACRDIANAVLLAKGKPIVVDCEENGQVQKDDIMLLITSRTKAIVIQHNFGYPCILDALDKIGIEIIEDCTHSFKSYYTFTHVLFSLGATKYVSGAEGGAILTNSKKTYNRIRNYLSESSFTRYPYRESDVHAAIALMQVTEINKYVRKRRKIAEYYTKKLFPLIGRISLLYEENNHAPYRFVIKLRDKRDCDDCLIFCKRHGIQCERPITLHSSALTLEHVESNQETFFSLPIYPSLSCLERRRVISVILKYFKKDSGRHNV